MTAKTPQSKKQKGNRAERAVAQAYRSSGLFPKAQRMPMSGAMQFNKGDIFKGEHDEWCDEVKCQEKVKLWEFWKQTEEQAGMYQKPVLHITGNHRPILTVMRMDDYMDLRAALKQWEEYATELEKKLK